MVVAETLADARAAIRTSSTSTTKPCLNHAVALSTCQDEKTAQVHAEAPRNTCFEWELGNKAETEAALRQGGLRAVVLDLTNNRLIPNAMEPRAACIGEYDKGSGIYHAPHDEPEPACRPPRPLRLRWRWPRPSTSSASSRPMWAAASAPRFSSMRKKPAASGLAAKVGRPIKWTGDRSEAFLSDAHGRDHLSHAELALDKDGKFLGLRVKTVANLGAYLSTFSASVPTYLYGTLLSGQYDLPAIYVEVDGVYTHTAPVDAYRGAGRPEATYLVERIVETAARETGIDPAELRRRNYIRTFPHQTPVIMNYDAGDYEASLEAAMEAIDYKGFAARKSEAASRGKLRGIGMSSYIEACGLAPSAAVGSLGAGVGLWESAEVRVNPTGNIEVLTGSHSHGQGHETTFAQLVALRASASRSTMSRSFTATPTGCSSAWAPTARAPAPVGMSATS